MQGTALYENEAFTANQHQPVTQIQQQTFTATVQRDDLKCNDDQATVYEDIKPISEKPSSVKLNCCFYEPKRNQFTKCRPTQRRYSSVGFTPLRREFTKQWSNRFNRNPLPAIYVADKRNECILSRYKSVIFFVLVCFAFNVVAASIFYIALSSATFSSCFGTLSSISAKLAAANVAVSSAAVCLPARLHYKTAVHAIFAAAAVSLILGHSGSLLLHAHTRSSEAEKPQPSSYDFDYSEEDYDTGRVYHDSRNKYGIKYGNEYGKDVVEYGDDIDDYGNDNVDDDIDGNGGLKHEYEDQDESSVVRMFQEISNFRDADNKRSATNADDRYQVFSGSFVSGSLTMVAFTLVAVSCYSKSVQKYRFPMYVLCFLLSTTHAWYFALCMIVPLLFLYLPRALLLWLVRFRVAVVRLSVDAAYFEIRTKNNFAGRWFYLLQLRAAETPSVRLVCASSGEKHDAVFQVCSTNMEPESNEIRTRLLASRSDTAICSSMICDAATNAEVGRLSIRVSGVGQKRTTLGLLRIKKILFLLQDADVALFSAYASAAAAKFRLPLSSTLVRRNEQTVTFTKCPNETEASNQNCVSLTYYVATPWYLDVMLPYVKLLRDATSTKLRFVVHISDKFVSTGTNDDSVLRQRSDLQKFLPHVDEFRLGPIDVSRELLDFEKVSAAKARLLH